MVNTTLTSVTIYKGSMVAHPECVDETSINVAFKTTEDRVMDAAYWGPNTYYTVMLYL